MVPAFVLATLLAGGAQPQTEASVPSLRMPEIPLTADVVIGWSQEKRVDPFGRFGPTSFTAGMPLVGARLRGQSWYVELAGQMMFTSLTNRNVTASVGRDLLRTGSLRWTVSGEFADVRFRREDFRTGDVLIGTTRTATIGMAGIGIGLGPFAGASVRVTALGGLYKNRYGSVVELPGFTGDEPMADDDVPVVGARVEVSGFRIRERIEISGSVRFLRLSGGHAPSVPHQEYSGSASLNVRLFRIRGKQLFVGGFARFGPAGPSIITDKTFGLRGIWRLK